MTKEQEQAALAAAINKGLKALWDQNRVTAKAISDEIGVSEQAISRWRHTGKVDRHNLEELENILWREIGFDLLSRRANLSKETKLDKVPLLSWDQITLKGIKKVAYIGEKIDHIEVPAGQYSRQAFAATVEGDAMVSPEGSFSFPPGCQIIIDPSVSPQSGDFVVAELPDGGVTFKELVIDGNRRYLKPLNPRYFILDGTNATVIGVVCQALLNTRRS